MSFANPLWLLLAFAVAALLALFWRRADRRRRADLERFASLHLLPDLTAGVSLPRRRRKRGLLLAGVVLLGVAFAGPQYGFTWEESRRRGIDVLIAIDVSRSMLAQDVVPNRLERAKLAITDLVRKLGGDRIGLIAFAGSAFLQCPLTLDHGAFLEALQALQPGVIPAPGSDLASAIRAAEEALRTEAHNVKLLVLFSDGEDLGGGAIETARQVAESGIKVFTVGVGSPNGELIPLAAKGGGTEFLKDPQGQFVKSRLDADTLRQVAELTGAFYEPLGQHGEGVDAVYERALAPLPKEELASRMRRVPLDRFQWPLALALLCLVVEPLLGERRGRRVQSVVLALLLLGASGAHAASPHEAERLYAAGEYDKALEAYREAAKGTDDAKLSFNVGAAAYKAGAYADAASAFAEALRSADPGVQERSFYNLGNAHFRAGQKAVEDNPQQTLQTWQQALDAYDGALRLDANDEDARFNREFVQREIAKLQEQQQQQQKGEQDEKNDQQKKEQEEQQKSQQDQQGDEKQQGEQREQQGGQDQQQASRQQDEQQEGQHKPEQQPGSEKQDESKQQAGESGDEGQGEQREASPEQGGKPGEPNEQQPGTESARAAQKPPGHMSPAEARELLDSLHDDAASLPTLQASQQKRSTAQDAERDW